MKNLGEGVAESEDGEVFLLAQRLSGTSNERACT